MQKRKWLHTVMALAALRALVFTAYAQENMPVQAAIKSPMVHSAENARHGIPSKTGFGFQSRLEKAVGLTPEQRDTVRGLLAQQHEALRSLRESMEPKYQSVQEDTDTKIRALLNPDQQKKLDAFLAKQKQGRSARTRRPA
jgi:hypothetical protein